ncbi:MotA/TolQ/ExbB proton channel family protein, partial [Thermosipho sp. 1244]|uniref:MotA/TolQ/ExbB proton channel family protein n=1 Tax=Thermosipho sp. 1244 TaxID=1755816 RepID=UPI001BDF2881
MKNNDLSDHEMKEIYDFLDFYPNFFITLGILGTFLGIVVGITNLRFENEETLKLGINGLLSSMRTAFISSIAGIIFSITSHFMNKKLFIELAKLEEKKKNRFLDEIRTISKELKEI